MSTVGITMAPPMRRAEPPAFQVSAPRHLVVDEAQIRNGVHGAEIARADLLSRASRPFGGGLSISQLLGGFDQAPVVLPAVVLVRHDLAGGIGSGTDLADMGGAIVIPTVLIPSHELEAHRLACRLREDRGCLSHIVGAA